MIKKSILILLFFSECISAQELAKKIRPIDFYMQVYACNFIVKGDRDKTFKNEFPNSMILANNVVNSEGNNITYGSGVSTLLSFGMGVPIRVFKSTKFTNSLRFGYDGLGELSFGPSSLNENRIRLDSTYYPQYDASLMKDSVYVSQIQTLVSGNIHQIKTDFLFRFLPEKRFTFYSGLGVGVALFENRDVEITKKEGQFIDVYSSIVDSNNIGTFYSNDVYSSLEEVEHESYDLKIGYSFYSYIPFGIDWKISKQENFLGKFHVFTEGKIGARFSDVYLNSLQTTFYLSGQTGVRLSI
jgi:hypothetical protein